MISKRIIIQSGIIIVAAAGIFCSYGFLNGGDKYSTAKVEKGQVVGSVTESGNIRGEKEMTYYSLVSAPVGSFDLEVGDVVKSGERLADYDLTELSHAADLAALSYEETVATVDGQLKQSNENQARYAAAVNEDAIYAQLYANQREKAQELSEAQYAEDYYTQCAKEGVAKKIAEKNEEILDKQQKLNKQDYQISLDGEAVTEKQIKNRKKTVRELNDLNDELADLNTESASIYANGYNPAEYAANNDNANVLEDINRNWQEAKTNKQAYEGSYLNSSQKEALAKQEESAASAASYAGSELDKAKNGITADFSGVVTACNIKKDSYVTKGTPLFTVESSDDLKVRVKISRYDIGRIALGQKAKIDVAGNEYEGEVSYINHLAEKDSGDKSKVNVDVHVTNPDEYMILGVEADVTIYTEDSGDASIIPYKAYYVDSDGSYCYCIENGVVTKKYFTAGVVNDDYVQIIDGLSPDAVVIVDAVTDDAVGKKAISK